MYNWMVLTLSIIEIVIAILLVIVILLQNDRDGDLGSLSGSSTANFFEQNQAKTRKGKLKRITVILGIAFAVVAGLIALAQKYGYLF